MKIEAVFILKVIVPFFLVGSFFEHVSLKAQDSSIVQINTNSLHQDISEPGKSYSSSKVSKINDETENYGDTHSHHSTQKTNWIQRNPEDFFREMHIALRMNFATPEPRFRPHEVCKKSASQLFLSYHDSLKKSQLSGADLIPNHGAIFDLNLYFQMRGRFYQLSLEPINQSLDEYKVSLIQSRSQDLSLDLVRIENGRLANLNNISRDDAHLHLKSLIEDFSAQGARWGTRTLILADLQLADHYTQQDFKKGTMVEFHDGALWGFMNEMQECHLSTDGSLECLCQEPD